MKFEIYYPEKTFPQLYDDVMRLGIFPDSKTFSDASPRFPVKEINAAYHNVDRSDKTSVLGFVHQNFQLPFADTNETVLELLPIDQHISSLWSHLTKEADNPKNISSLIPLPHAYVVPGGRFREIYYWDSYFTMLGLRISDRTDVIRDMIKNFAWQLDEFGYIPNGNRSYFLSRSQPPFFSLMVNLLADIDGSEIYEKYLPHLILEYVFWMDGADDHSVTTRRIVMLGKEQYLNRYFDDSETPRAESWAEDVEMAGSDKTEAKLFYRHLKAACESGWDFSSRWLKKENDLRSIRTLDIIPPDLNSLLYIHERTIARAYQFMGREEESISFETKANERAALMHKTLWNETEGYYSDFIISDHTFGMPSLAMMFPLFAGIATPQQAERTIKYVTEHFLQPGGWVTTNQHTGQQWDAPNGWAPLQWIIYEGLKKYGADDLAHDAARRWLSLNEKVFQRTGRMMEKYNVEDLSLEAGGGEYPVQDGFGWTNGVYLALSNEINKFSPE